MLGDERSDTDPISALELEPGQRARILNLLERVAHNVGGPNELPTNICHQIHRRDPLILQLTPGHPMRLAFFYDANRHVICTHMFRKSGGNGRTPKREINRAIELRRQYFEAVAAKSLVVIE